MKESYARLMRAIGRELMVLRPELRSDAAIERVDFAKLVLDDMASDIDVLPELALQQLPDLRRALEQSLQELAAQPGSLDVAAYGDAYALIPPQTGVVAEVEIAALRALAAKIVRDLADQSSGPGGAVARKCIERLGITDYRWLKAYDEARAKRAKAGFAASGNDTDSTITLPTDLMAAYLRRRFPNETKLNVTSVTLIPGGRSKRTFRILLEGASALPSEIIMRQDIAAIHVSSMVRDEYEPLRALAETGLLVPKPLLLEAETTDLGPPFLLVEKIRGGPPGQFFMMYQSCPEAFRGLARTLGRLHSTPPEKLGLKRSAKPVDALARQIAEFQEKWRFYSLTPSAMIDFAYSWALQHCEASESAEVPVHGDCGPHNLMVEDDRLEGLLDWEFMHVGDPSEDLGVARVYCEGILPWSEFMEAYQEGGGAAVPDQRTRVGMMLNWLKGTVLVSRSERNFVEGGTDDFIKGANSYTGLRKIEGKIAGILGREFSL